MAEAYRGCAVDCNTEQLLFEINVKEVASWSDGRVIDEQTNIQIGEGSRYDGVDLRIGEISSHRPSLHAMSSANCGSRFLKALSAPRKHRHIETASGRLVGKRRPNTH